MLDLFPDRVKERAGVEWNRTAERVDAVSALLYENLVIEETRSGRRNPNRPRRCSPSAQWKLGRSVLLIVTN